MGLKKKILAIDDDELMLELLKTELDDVYDVTTAISAASALEVLELQSPDMIVLDISMPEINGFELCKVIKSNPEKSHIPVMFLTALEETDMLIKAFHIGAVDFMIKPVNFLELKMRVDLHIRQGEMKRQLLAENITQGKEIESLSKELSLYQNLVEEAFQDREKTFTKKAEFHEKMYQTTSNNQRTLERLNDLLRKQEELIASTKKTMGL